MTNKDWQQVKLAGVLTIGILFGLMVGVVVTDARINSEIRTDQLDLQAQVEEILEQKQEIEGVITEFLRQTELIKAERESLERLKIALSKGE